MEYMSVKEAAQRWNISERRVRALCESGRIEGAARCGDWVWSIPTGIQRPADGRTLRYIKNRNLKAGAQDYKTVDKIRNSTRATSLTEYQKASIIQEAFAYSDTELSREQILNIFKLKQQDIPLDIQVMVLNMKSAVNSVPFTVSEKIICSINKRLLQSIYEDEGGQYNQTQNQSQEFEAMLSQYAGPWSVLHPVARAAFIFSEIIRINPFKRASIQTAFIVLQSELIKAKLPPVLFGTENISQLKAALVSASIRGNLQTLVSMILEAECRK